MRAPGFREPASHAEANSAIAAGHDCDASREIEKGHRRASKRSIRAAAAAGARTFAPLMK